MAVFTLNQSGPSTEPLEMEQQLPSPSFRARIIWEPDMSDADIQAQVDAAFVRTYFMQAWLDGRLDTTTFLDFLDEQRIDVFDLPQAWDQGLIV
jgi:hypothetical protein